MTVMNILNKMLPSLRLYSFICRRSYFVTTHKLVPAFVLKSNCSIVHVRNFWETFPYVRPLFYAKDKLDQKYYELIYHSGLFHYTFYGQLISILVMAAEISKSIQYAAISVMYGRVTTPITEVGPFTITYDALTFSLLILFFLQTLLLYSAAQKVCLRIYYNRTKDEYVLVSLAFNPFRSKLNICKPGNLVPFHTTMYNFMLGNHKLNDQKYYIRYDSFKSSEHYNNLIGKNYID